MNTCGTCKHFGELVGGLDTFNEDSDEVPNTRLHKCLLLKHLNGGKDRIQRLADVAGVMDGSGYHAVFCVSEEFGCNRWESR